MAEEGLEIPKFVVDLSLPPRQRYDHIVPHFQPKIDSCNLHELFDELLIELAGEKLGNWLKNISPALLRRVRGPEETEELVGISRASGISKHILVAFNVLLDLLLGCTSGGVRVAEEKSSPRTRASSKLSSRASRMIHFRTLDWGMDRLRNIVVELDFVRHRGGPVIATSLTYLGYVGVLTGVRKGLSMSLNFRPHHASSTWWDQAAFRYNQAMVVLGFRHSISSLLRQTLLGPPAQQQHRPAETKEKRSKSTSPTGESDEFGEADVRSLLSKLATSPSTSAYLIFCTPQKVYVVDKDNRRGPVRDSDTFLTAYNHDVADEKDPSQLKDAVAEIAQGPTIMGMDDIVACSLDRKCHLDELWRKSVDAFEKKNGESARAISMADVREFVRDPEIRNEETHYAIIMDPSEGKVLWRRVFEEGT
ncbi:unnamed protein product [Clonostachys chloroleuca]|uniref:ceramidase n=1 Tax=Clonostachys chloroleuca TaxID=1926264 RepID=A0AA35VKP3_9HYPO|nr:unnamed protein product [Clonostachys chloroleuca]